MKGLHLTVGLIFLSTLNLSGQGLHIQPGSHFVFNGDAAIVINDGNFINDGALNSGIGSLYMKGSVPDTDSKIQTNNSSDFNHIIIDKTVNGVQLESGITIKGDLDMRSGTLDLNGKTLTFDFTGTIINETETNRIWGDSGQVVTQTNLNAPTNINPSNIGLTISSSDNLGTFIIRRIHQAPTLNGGLGITRQYKVEYINTGLTIDYSFAYFNSELNGNHEDWIEPWKLQGSWQQVTPNATDTIANTIRVNDTNSDLDTLWAFANGQLQVTPKVILQGNYAGSSLMTDNLRINNLIPTTEPYTGLGYTHVNAGGESVSTTVFDVTGNDAIVDWIFLEVRDPLDSTSVKQTVSTLLQKDGDIVDLDGVSPVNIPNLGNDDYYIVIRHRNHLPIRSATKLNLSPDNAAYDFSSALTQAWDNPAITTNDAMKDLGTSVYGMISGDINGNQNIRATGPPFINDFSSLLSTLGGGTNILTSQYDQADLNMDGTIRATGPPFINDFSTLLSFLGSSTTILNAHID